MSRKWWKILGMGTWVERWREYMSKIETALKSCWSQTLLNMLKGPFKENPRDLYSKLRFLEIVHTMPQMPHKKSGSPKAAHEHVE
jgi:hypothetical protein